MPAALEPGELGVRPAACERLSARSVDLEPVSADHNDATASGRRVLDGCGPCAKARQGKGEPIGGLVKAERALALERWGCLLYTSPSPRD